MAKFPSQAPSKFAPRTSGSGGNVKNLGNAGKVKHISAPTKPKMASMKSAHGKLIPGNC